MNVQQQKQQKGFTIIEVILVLAIAALIFLMVFLALPALQRGQRDTARKDDVSIVASSVTNLLSNNNGDWSKVTIKNLQQYADKVSSNSQNSSNEANITVNTSKPGSITAGDTQIIVVKGMACDGVSPNGTATLKTGTNSGFAVVTRLESGSNSAYCLDS